MSVSSINQSGYNSALEISRAKAEHFANAGDDKINRLARKSYNKLYKEENKEFDKRVNTTLKTLPLVAVASGLATGKGKKGALLSGLSWGFALIAPSIVGAVNKKAVDNNPKLAKSERKHPLSALAVNVGASLGVFAGLTAVTNKLLSNNKVVDAGKKVFKPVMEGASKLAGKVASSSFVNSGIATVKEVATKTGKAIPNSVKNMAKTVSESSIAKNLASVAKSSGKYIAKNAPALLVFGTMGALVAKGVSEAKKMSAIKSEIKDAQFETAKTLMNTYSSENRALKQENEILSAAVEANF